MNSEIARDIAEYLSLSIAINADYRADLGRPTLDHFVRANHLAFYLQMILPPETWEVVLRGVTGADMTSRLDAAVTIRRTLECQTEIPREKMAFQWPQKPK